MVYSPCFPVWGEEKVMTIYDAGPLPAGPLCGLLTFAIETPIFIARQADSHESLEFPIRANHPIRANRANRFARITPLSMLLSRSFAVSLFPCPGPLPISKWSLPCCQSLSWGCQQCISMPTCICTTTTNQISFVFPFSVFFLFLGRHLRSRSPSLSLPLSLPFPKDPSVLKILRP